MRNIKLPQFLKTFQSKNSRSKMTSTTTKRSLRILCFGDSLTEGYSQWGTKMTPYSRWMQRYLKENLGNEYEIKFVTDGKSGDCVTGGFQMRMDRHYPEHSTTNPYDWIIYLGGTNDLAYSLSPQQIFSHTQSILALPLSLGTKILIMTIPECKFRGADKQRNELNGLIKKWVEEHDEGRLYVFDLWDKMRFHGISEEERKERWDDHLHFTERGYEIIGEMVGERLVEILRSDGKSAAVDEQSGEQQSQE